MKTSPKSNRFAHSHIRTFAHSHNKLTTLFLTFSLLFFFSSCSKTTTTTTPTTTPTTPTTPTVTTYQVTFNTNGGSAVTPQTINDGDKAQKPTDPTKTDYLFENWYKETTLTTLFDFSTTAITANITLYAKWKAKEKPITATMAWGSMREGLIQFDNGTQGVKTIGVIVSKSATAPAYADVKDLPSFYTRKTKADGTPRTVYLSMTDKMTTAKFNANVTVSVDGKAAGFVSAITAAPELLQPNTSYYAHLYEITGTTGTAIEKLLFTTENFPANFPTTRGTYSSFFNQTTTASTSPTMEYKATESYLIPVRFHYLATSGGPYTFRIGTSAPYELAEASKLTRPFKTTRPPVLFYDLYNITPSGAVTSVALWDGMIKTENLSKIIKIDALFGGAEFEFYSNKKTALVTE